LWGAAGAVAAFVGLLRVGAIPGVRGTVAWIRRNLDLGGPFVAEFFAAGGSGYAGLWLLGLVSGLSAVGAVRAGQTIFGPINVLYLGIYVTLVPEGARHASRDVERVRKSMTGASVILVAVAVAATAIALAVPASLGRVFFGDTWAKARGVLLPLGLALCGGGVMAGATSGIRALSAAPRSLRTRLLTLPAMVVLPLVGAFIADERGFCIGFAVATWLSAVVSWVSFRNALAIAPRPADEGAALSPTVPEPRPA
jgi:O-antigen/teichoic acid export membrane protein